jgi:hypothetical protein
VLVVVYAPGDSGVAVAGLLVRELVPIAAADLLGERAEV